MKNAAKPNNAPAIAILTADLPFIKTATAPATAKELSQWWVPFSVVPNMKTA